MFVIATDFDVPPYTIPKLSDVSNSFVDFVEAEEERKLREILGNELYDEFIAGLAGSVPLQKWTDLQDGADYTYEGKIYQWVGMRKMLIPFIFSMWVRDSTVYHTGIGIVKPKAENSEVANPGHKVSRAYNDFARKAGYDYSLKNTLYGFLTVNRTDYENADGSLFFCSPGTMNVMNL